MTTWTIPNSIELSSYQKNGSFQGADLKHVNFLEALKISSPQVPFEYRMLDTIAWETIWSGDPSYIDQTPDYESFKRIIRQRENLKEIEEIPAISFQNTNVGVTPRIADGRHRFCALRELKVPIFLAAIPTRILSEFSPFLARN